MNVKVIRIMSRFLCGVVCFALTISAIAQDAQEGAVSQAEVTEQNRLSEPTVVVSATDLIEEWRKKALEQLNLKEGVTSDGKYIVFASANVSVKDTDPHYGAALVNAFDTAMLDAQQEILMVRFGREVVSQIRETFRDQSTDNREIPLDSPSAPGKNMGEKALRILDKTLRVTEAKLDKALDKYGVPRDEYVTLPPEKKKILFKNALLKETLKNASGEIAGIFPVQTTVRKDAKGNTKVGMIVIMSHKSVQVATDIRLQRHSLIRGKGIDLHERMIPQNAEQWIGQLGTRLVYALDGTPVIVSYGMGSFVPDGDDDYINEELRKEASKQAIDNADSQIATVVAGYMSAEEQRMQGENIERAVTRQMTVNASTIEKITKNIIHQSKSFAKAKASISLKGISTLSSPKFIKLPSGQQMCCVIRYWSYAGLDAANNLNRPPKPRPQGNGNVKGTGKAYKADGFKVNDIDDF